MMRKRNVISLLLTFCLCFSMISPVSATDINEVSDNLYIFSKQCPEEYINFAQETVGYMLWDHSVENPYLGTPFTFSNEDSDIYYFPIYSNGEIALTFRVHLGEDGEFSGVVSPVFADDLNAIASMTSLSDPLRLVYTNKDEYAAVMFTLDDYEEEVQISPIVNDDKGIVATFLNDEFEIINCTPVEQIQVVPYSRASKNLNLSIIEHQSDRTNWCLAYCTAAVMRYKGVEKRAYQVMQETRKTGEVVLDESVMGKERLVNYMRQYGFCTVKSEESPIYANVYSDIVSEINRDRPLIFNISKGSSAHAVVARGYEDVKGTVSIWNPYYKYYETVNSLDRYTPAEHSGVYHVTEYWYNIYK